MNFQSLDPLKWNAGREEWKPVDENVRGGDSDPDNIFGVQDACRLAIDLFAGSEDLSVARIVQTRTTDQKMSVDGVAKFSREREKGKNVVVESCHVCCLLND